MSWLCDTDILSEPKKPRPALRVVEWLEAKESQLYTSAFNIAELAHGIKLLPAGRRRSGLQNALQEIIASMGERILRFDFRTGQRLPSFKQAAASSHPVFIFIIPHPDHLSFAQPHETRSRHRPTGAGRP